MSKEKSLKDKAISIQGKKYVLVSDRVLYFNEQYPNGSITTELVSDPESDQIIVKATVYPTLVPFSLGDVEINEHRKFTGYSQAIKGDGMVNKTAALENAETSAVGRALAMMGIGVIESIASADEMNKAAGSTGTRSKVATEKQIKWIRDEAAKVSGFEQAEDLDKWVKEHVGSTPQEVAIFKVKEVVDKIRGIGEARDKKADTKYQQNIDSLTEEDIKNAGNLDDIPY